MEPIKKENPNNITDTPKQRPVNAFTIMLLGYAIMIAAAVILSLLFSWKLRNTLGSADVRTQEYKHHFVFISGDSEKEFWNEVFCGAKKQAEKENVYLEELGGSQLVDYEASDLLRIAVNSSVDGIIYCGHHSEEALGYMEQARQKGIFVVNLQDDIEDVGLQCFVGVNSYDMGLEFGKQICSLYDPELAPDGHRIMILAEDTATDSRMSLLSLGITDCFAQQLPDVNLPEIEIRKVDTSDAFSAEEAIRDIYTDGEQLPEFMVCLNSNFTECICQGSVDYNRVGAMKILGSYVTDTILDAVEKQLIVSTVKLDTEDMGEECVKVLMDYKDNGYASSFVSVSTTLIGQQEATAMQEEVSHAEK